MNNFEAWRTTTDTSMGSLLAKTTETAARITSLEKAPPPLPPPPPPVGWVPWTVDLNREPSPGERPSTPTDERPSGHNAGGGILGPGPRATPPPITSQGMIPGPPPCSFDVASGSSSHTSHAGSVPKMDFPKFDGDNPWLNLWSW